MDWRRINQRFKRGRCLRDWVRRWECKLLIHVVLVSFGRARSFIIWTCWIWHSHFRLRCLRKLELYLFLLDRTLLLMSLRTRKVSLPWETLKSLLAKMTLQPWATYTNQPVCTCKPQLYINHFLVCVHFSRELFSFVLCSRENYWLFCVCRSSFWIVT